MVAHPVTQCARKHAEAVIARIVERLDRFIGSRILPATINATPSSYGPVFRSIITS